MKLITYIEFNMKHLKFAKNNMNPPFLDYNLKRYYFTEKYIYSKLLYSEKVKIKKKIFSFNKNKSFKEFKIPEVNKNENHKNSEKSQYTKNVYLKNNELKKRKILKEKTNNYLFNNQTLNANRIKNAKNINNLTNIKINNRFYITKIKKIMQTINNQKIIKCETENIKENRNAEILLNNKKEKNILSTNTNKYINKCENIDMDTIENINANINIYTNTNNILDNLQKKSNEINIQISKDINVIINDIKKENLIIKKKSFYINKITLIINDLFEKHLLLMNCIIAGVLYFISDVTCQLMEAHKNNKKYDLLRTIRMSFIGVSLEGPIMTWWYGKILNKFIKSKPNTFIYKSLLPTLFDNFVFGPIHLIIFFFYNGVLKNQNRSEILDNILNTGRKVFLISLMTWTPLTLINFIFVPRIYQASVIFFADFFWVILLSWYANKK